MILTRYLGREVFHTFIALIVILLIVVISTMFIKVLSSAAAGGLTSSAIITLLGLGLPQYFSILLPICLFFAIIIAYGRMFADNELLVMFACGMSWRKLLRITLLPALLIFAVVAVLTLYLVPKVLFSQYSLQTQVGQKKISVWCSQDGFCHLIMAAKFSMLARQGLIKPIKIFLVTIDRMTLAVDHRY